MITLLCGGVGGSKLALGLYSTLPPDSLTVIGNTGDDLEVLGLHVSPDLDTIMYTLAGLANPATGWGLVDDTFRALDMLHRYGHDPWFRLGDRDLATHIWRTYRLRCGARLTDVTLEMTRSLSLSARVLPMCDERVATRVHTSAGTLDFQEYFVQRGYADDPLAVHHVGSERSSITGEVRAALSSADAIILAPSNPVVSVGPILAVPGVRELIASTTVPRVAVSPIVGHDAVAGPAGRLMRAKGFDVSASGVAMMYRDIVDVLVVDTQDADCVPEIEDLGIRAYITDTIMCDPESRRQLARHVLEAAQA